ncbi:MAG TPA: TetR/AcrR family transcriptional regulator [Mycobacteriales bacterium]
MRPTSLGTTLRRAPVQERSAARVSRMLDACGELIWDIGYDATTTTVIARRAGVSVGSLYQFFPDKRAVVRALTQRNLDTFLRQVGVLFANQKPGNWWDAVDAVVDAYVELHRTVPGFRAVHMGDVIDEYLLEPDQDNDSVLVDRLAELLGDRLGVTVDERLRLALLVAVRVGDCVLTLAFRRHPDGDEHLVGEAKWLIHSYLARHLESRVEPKGEILSLP